MYDIFIFRAILIICFSILTLIKINFIYGRDEYTNTF